MAHSKATMDITSDTHIVSTFDTTTETTTEITTETTTENDKKKSRGMSIMAPGHSSLKTSIYVNGLYYNLDRIRDVPKEGLTEDVLKALVAYEIIHYSSISIANSES